jgi:phosphatidylinositol alpha-1,6-mannosyltransferase
VRRHPVFLTRKFPPSVGGMETLADGVWRSMRTARPDSVLIAHGGPNKALIWWVPVAIGRLLGLLVRRNAEVVLTGDALMYALTSPLLRLFRVKHATMIMGLDVTYDNPLYRAIVHPALRRAEQIISISEATAERAIQFGVPADRITVLRLGVEAPPTSSEDKVIARAKLHELVGLGEKEFLLLTLGRLVPRKGAAWFVESVLPRLSEHTHYILAGDGPDAKRIAASAQSAGVRVRVHLLGRVDDDQREIVMRGADLFVQPNVAVPGDMEGFGLVTIEAAMRHTLVVAADLEGIKDAVVDGETGLLLPSGDAEIWAARINALLADRAALATRGTSFGMRVDELYGAAQMGQALMKCLQIT